MRPSFLNDTASETLAGRLNTRTKLMLCVISSLAAITLSNPYALSLLAVVSTLYALTAMSPLTLVRTYCLVVALSLVSLAFTALLSLLLPGLIKWEIRSFVSPYLRMIISLNSLFALAFSSRIRELMQELQALGRLTWVHVPLTVAIRFLPTFLDDCAQIMDAYRLRSALGKKNFFAKLASLWRGFLVPLTFRLLRSADDLAVAAELKGVGSGKRTKRAGNPLTRWDVLALGVAALSLAAAGSLQALYGGAHIPGMG